MEFQFTKPEDRVELSDYANAAIAFASLVGQLAIEKRTVVYVPDGRPENVSEHSHMVSLVASELAAQYFPELNADRIARLGNVHDIVEVYVGDTPTHIITEAEQKAKAEREHAALIQIRHDYAAYPHFIALVDEYEAQQTPEARFVRMVDKLAPLLAHINDEGRGLRQDGFTPNGIRENAAERARAFLQDYPDMVDIIAIRNELAEFAAKGLEAD